MSEIRSLEVDTVSMAKDIEGCQELWHYKQPALATTKDHRQPIGD